MSVGIAFAATTPCVKADTSDVSQILVGRVAEYLQLSPADPVMEPTPYAFVADAEGVAADTIFAGAFTSSIGPSISLSSADNQSFAYAQNFNSLAQLQAAFPDGSYSFNLTTATSPSDVFTSIDLGSNFPLTIPKISNTEWRSVILQFDSTNDFTFTWNDFSDFNFDPAHLSQVEFQIADIFNDLVFDEFSDSPITGMTIPAGTLSPGIYIGRVLFTNADRGQLDQTFLAAFNINMTEFIISAVDGPPVITSTTDITVNQGQLFIYGIDSTNAASQFGATNLPPGVFADSTFGLIGGFPSAQGTYQVGLSATNVVGTGTATLTVNVVQSTGLAITSSTRAAGSVGDPFRFQVLAPGASQAARLTAIGLPAGLSADPVTGQISGTPTTAGDFLVRLHVADDGAAADGALMISLNDDPAFPGIKSATSATLTPGQDFSYTINATPESQVAAAGYGSNASDPPTYSIIGEEQLPTGLSFDAKTGTISGKFQGAAQRTGDSKSSALSGGALVGNVQLVATNSRGTSTVPLVFFSSPVGAVNISTRLAIAGGDNLLIGGFIVTGNAPKKLIVRALGPSLPVPGALQDPVLEIHTPNGATLLSNDSWRSENAQAIIDSGVPPGNDAEAAIVAAFEPGSYTAVVSGKNGGTGVALVELFDLGTASIDASSDAKLANISTRGLVQSGDNVMIGGFIISQVQSKVIVRAIGPSLTQQGVAGALQDTVLELHGTNGEILATNDDWQSTQEQQITDTGIPPTDPRESAIVATLDPGSYTAVVRGKNDSTGVALVEVYAIQ